MSFLPSEDTYNIHKTCALEILSLSRMINEPFFPVFNSNSSARSLLMFGRCQGNDIRKAGMVLSHFLLATFGLLRRKAILSSMPLSATLKQNPQTDTRIHALPLRNRSVFPGCKWSGKDI